LTSTGFGGAAAGPVTQPDSTKRSTETGTPHLHNLITLRVT
jgi:hypothetical protein